MLEAEGEAEARRKLAAAEAESIRQVAEALSAVRGDPVQYLVAVRYMETLGKMVSGKDNKVVYLPYEASGVLSALGGIKEILDGARREVPDHARRSEDQGALGSGQSMSTPGPRAI